MNLLRVRDSVPQWPYSRSQLAADEPRLSISAQPHAGELALMATLDPPVLVYQVQPAEQPTYDPLTQRVEQVMPEPVNGQWLQRWEVVNLPPAPLQEPEPQWVAFGATLVADAAVNGLVATARDNAPVLHLMLGVGLGQAAQGDLQTFGAAWAAARGAGMVSPELIEHMQELAVGFNLPAEFIAGLGS